MLCVYTVYTFTLMEHTTITLISYSQNRRSYFFLDYDDARSFYFMYDGEFEYTNNGYRVTI